MSSLSRAQVAMIRALAADMQRYPDMSVEIIEDTLRAICDPTRRGLTPAQAQALISSTDTPSV